MVVNGGDTYTVNGETFAATYRKIGPGEYEKTVPVYAEKAESAGVVQTKEGSTAYSAGDFLVFNNADGSDAYAMGAEKFHELYELEEG